MESKLRITIPKPCHEDWNLMTPEETGRFCSVCSTGVVDFTNKTTAEIEDYYSNNKGKKICGRFKNSDVNTFDIKIPKSVLTQQIPFQKAFLLTLFIVMGTTLFSCKNHNDENLGKVIVEDTIIKKEPIMGLSLPPKDSIKKIKDVVQFQKPKKNIEIITGEVTATKIEQAKTQTVYESDEVYGMPGISIYPECKGGIQLFKDFVLNNYIFPQKANKINGILRAGFTIEKDGSLNGVKIIKDLGSNSGEALLNVLKKSPKWHPAEYQGKKTKFDFEITLYISNDTIFKTFSKKISAKIDSIELTRITKFDH